MRHELSRFGAPTGLADLVESWPAAVGEAIARNAWPSRVARDGTLHVATADSIWAFELGHRAAEIADRLGVAKLKFAPGQLPSNDDAATRGTPLEPSAEHRRRAAEIAAEIGDEKLREAVQKAVSLSLARGPQDP